MLYEADWSSGLGGWSGSSDWKTINGMLVNDGTNENLERWVTAPFKPEDIADYAIEAEIQVIRHEGGGCLTFVPPSNSFGLVARAAEEQGAYWAGVLWSCRGLFAQISDVGNGEFDETALTEKEFDPGTEWRVYRLEVQGNTLRLLIDGTLVLEPADNKYLAGGQIGLWSDEVQINVRSFRVIAL